MKSMVAYMSQSGSTRKVAEAIFAEIEGEKEICPLTEVEDLEGYDVIFVGFPIQQFGAPGEAKAFLERRCVGKKIALFITHAAPESTEGPLQAWLGGCRQAAAGASVVGMFDCQGELAPAVKQAMLNMGDPNLRRWAEMDNSQGQPDATRLARARAFASEIVAVQASASMLSV